MKIAYLGQMADVSSENGISKKIAAQIHEWRRVGHDVAYFSLVQTARVWDGLDGLDIRLVKRGPSALRLLRSLSLVRQLERWNPDVIYFRYAYHSAGFPRLFRKFPVVAEINSDDLAEYPLTLPKAKLVYHRLTRRRILSAVHAFVPVTHELGERFTGFGRPMEVIGNGIRLAEFSPAPLPPEDAGIRLVFVGSDGTPWHGLERLAEMAGLLPGLDIDVIGCTLRDWTAIAGDQPLPKGLHMHGKLPRAAYEPLLRRSTAAIGTLGLFRKQMDEACPLKVREYLALGLPVIGGYCDTDIPADADYFHRLPNTAAPLASQREQLAAFLARWQKQRVPREVIAHLDIVPKERRRLAFMSRIIAPSA